MSTNEPTANWHRLSQENGTSSKQSAHEAAQPDLEPEIHELVGNSRYQILEEIARGGFSRIFRAYDQLLKREIAIKLLRAPFRDDPRAKQRFLTEAKISARLQHPSITPIYEILKEVSDQYVISMPLVRGTTLGQRLAARQSPLEDVPRYLRVFEKICQAMAYAHEKGVIHRDLKPDNIMLGPFGEVFVMDWGIAKFLDCEATDEDISVVAASGRNAPSDNQGADESDTRTRVGSILGTPGMIPPEQARGEFARVGKPSDVFGLGAILCIILTGNAPFVGTQLLEVLRKAEMANMQGAYSLLDVSAFDEELITLTKNCLHAEPEDRPRDAGEVAQAITRYLEAKAEKSSREWLNVSTDGFWDVNLETNNVYLSPRFMKLFGYQVDELPNVAETWKKLLHPEDLKAALRAFKQHTKDGKPLSFPVRYRHKDGSTIWVLCRGVALKNEVGKISHVVGTNTDITALKQAEEALAERGRLAELGSALGVALTPQASLPTMLQHCAEALVNHLDVSVARIWISRESNGFPELQANAHRPIHFNGEQDGGDLGRSEVEWIIRNRRPFTLACSDQASPGTDQMWARQTGIVAYAGYPLIYQESLLGVVAVFSRQHLSPMILKTLGGSADRIAEAVAHWNDIERLRRSERRFALAVRGAEDAGPETSDSPMTILVAEDDVISRKMLTGLLNDWGYQTVTACDGSEAWRVLQGQAAPTLAILDRNMPGIDGIEICRRLRMQPTMTPTYVILLTAHASRSDVVIGLDAGANDYIAKPFYPEELRARVQVGWTVNQLQHRLASGMREFQDYVEDAPVGILVADEKGIITFANSRTGQIFGFEPGELVERSIEVLVPTSSRERHAMLRNGYLRNPKTRIMANRDLMGRRKDGTPVPCQIGLNAIHRGDSVRVVCTITDTTELQSTRDQLEQFFEMSLDLFCIAQVNGSLRRVNANYCATLGFSTEEILARSFFDLVHPDDAPAVRLQVQHLAEGRTVVGFRCRLRDCHGKDHWIEWNARSTPSGGLIYAVGREISEH